MRNEKTWDKLLQIKTCGRDDTNADEHHHPYEPTPYSVLERLAESGFFRPEDVVLDYGCGKGRVGFFLSYRTRARTIGIEYDRHIFEAALENRNTTISRVKPEFLQTRAEAYRVPSEVNRCYFFNPSPQSFSRRSWHGSWKAGTSSPGTSSCFSIIPPMNTSPS